jgi:pimeloyl-ACP methyl ester carboxylesterase
MRQADESRPWLVTIHGYGMGHAIADFQGIRARHLHGTLGMNVVAYVMPLHGPRRTTGTFGSDLFTGGVANIVHGEAQAMWDLRRIFSWIRSRGATKIGVKGLSLGGYTTALMACLEDDLACAIAGIPACDFIDLFRRHMPRDYGEIPAEVEAFWSDARRVLSVISPLAMRRASRARGASSSRASSIDWFLPRSCASFGSTGSARRSAGTRAATSPSCSSRSVREFLESAYRACGMVTAEARPESADSPDAPR